MNATSLLATNCDGSEPQLADSLHDALFAVIRGPRSWCATPADFVAFLKSRAIEPSQLERRHIDVGVLRTRFALYRDLVHQRVRTVLASCLPRTLLALGSECDVTLEQYCTECPWASPHLRDLVEAFVHFGCARWPTSPRYVPYVGDLARYEWARLEVASALDDAPLALADVSPEVTIGLRHATRLLKLHHGVHLTADAELPPRVGTYHVLLYLDSENEVSTVELSELAATVVGALVGGLPLARAAERGLAAAGLPLTSSNVAEVADLLNAMFTRGVFKRKSNG